MKVSQNFEVVAVAELKNRLSFFLRRVGEGKLFDVVSRGAVVARLVPVPKQRRNKTKLGCGVGSVRVIGDLTEPMIDSSDWEMLS